MKLVIQIPCFNEAGTLAQTIGDLPTSLDGIDIIEVLVIDDGSTDGTADIARQLGAHHIIRNRTNMGLARTFRSGLDASLHVGADIIVNTDGDNQYCGPGIVDLIRPILDGRADIVIGDRQTASVSHFGPLKRFLQWLGSGVVRKLAGIWVPDVVSGFRAFSREAAIRTNIVSSYSYTVETVIQAAKKDMAIVSVPIATNPTTRESRLFRSLPHFISQQCATILRMYVMYQPLRVFFYLGVILVAIGIIPIVRFLYLYVVTGADGHVQSLVLGGAVVMMGFVSLLAGLVADLISFNRQLLEFTLEKVRRIELGERSAPENGISTNLNQLDRAELRDSAAAVKSSS